MTLPRTMSAIEIAEFGGPEVLRPVERPVPTPGPGEVLVRVAAAGVNRPDLAQRQGVYPPPPGASDIPGLEIAGEIVALGEGVTGPAPGDRVAALVTGGGYAEYCPAPVETLLPVPEDVPLAQAGALPETVFTVWHNLFERGGLKAGETALIHGGASGIGTTAIQMAKARGARVIVTAGSDEKCAACLKLGADHAIDYRTAVFEEAVQEITEGRGADVILDMVGGDYLNRNVRAAAVEGRIVQIAFMSGAEPTLALFPFVAKRITLTGSLLRSRPLPEKAAMAEAIRREVWQLVADGRLRPVMDATYPLAEAAAAHARLEAGGHVGKILLEVAARS
jgi:NADPH2:quinone reductase